MAVNDQRNEITNELFEIREGESEYSKTFIFGNEVNKPCQYRSICFFSNSFFSLLAVMQADNFDRIKRNTDVLIL